MSLRVLMSTIQCVRDGVSGMLTSCAGSSVLAAVDPAVQLKALKFVK